MRLVPEAGRLAEHAAAIRERSRFADLTQAERCARLASAYSPEQNPLDPEPPEFVEPRASSWEGWLAVVFCVLAAVGTGALLAFAL